jgi:hypothetical protein
MTIREQTRFVFSRGRSATRLAAGRRELQTAIVSCWAVAHPSRAGCALHADARSVPDAGQATDTPLWTLPPSAAELVSGESPALASNEGWMTYAEPRFRARVATNRRELDASSWIPDAVSGMSRTASDPIRKAALEKKPATSCGSQGRSRQDRRHTERDRSRDGGWQRAQSRGLPARGRAQFHAVAALFALLCAACAHQQPKDWGNFDLLHGPRPGPAHTLQGFDLSDADYRQFVRWGEAWFRGATLGDERTATDVAGLMQAEIEVPCPAPAGCYERRSVLPYFARAIDALDGVMGNLFTGNGGPTGRGYTSDLVLSFPPGTRLLGIAVPERLHTGLDVEAGSPWPIGLPGIPVPRDEADRPYFVHPAELGAGPALDATRYRIGITCALCHYSLDIDWDGQADLRSAWPDQPTPGSAFQPEDAWAVGNQDLHVGWLFALTGNPMLGFAVLSGPVGAHDIDRSARWVEWVRDNYERAPLAVKREVVRGMLTQPPGFADISPNALYDNVQFPLLYTRHVWPYNYDGSLINASDRNSSVWTTALDFTGLIGLASDRSTAGQSALYWETTNVYRGLSSETFADLMVFDSPAVRFDPAQRKILRDDILGISDGVPGLLRPDCVSVVDGAPGGMVPPEILAKARQTKGLVHEPKDFGSDAAERGAVVALVGTRVRTSPEIAAQIDLPALLARYPGLNGPEFMNEAVSLMLDSLDPPRRDPRLPRPAAAQLQTGYAVFKASGCETCHRGPFLTDNLIHRLSTERRDETGLPSTPSTAAWRIVGRGRGPALGTQPDRMLNSRVLQLYAAPNYDPIGGRAISSGSPLNGLFGDRIAGYKTAPLRYLWGSAPYLHDGGVAVTLQPNLPAEADLAALLRRPEADKLYGMGAIWSDREREPSRHLWPNPALSLQALLLRDERARVIAANRTRNVAAPESDWSLDSFGDANAEFISMESLGASGIGHEFFIDDVPGGEKITALVVFLLNLDEFPLGSQRGWAAAQPTAEGGYSSAATLQPTAAVTQTPGSARPTTSAQPTAARSSAAAKPGAR